MPIYEYQCQKCGRIHEAIQKFSDKPLKTCGQCSGRLQRLISQSSFHLKGTGWYVTDYAKKSKSSTSSASGEASAKNAKPKDADKSPPANTSSNDK